MPEAKRPLKVFLCHARSDVAAVRTLYTRLVKDGVDAWFDKEKLLPGQDWELEIRKAVLAADVVVVCLSKQFNQAGFRQKEVRIAIDSAMEKPEGEIFIIPARLEECENLESLRKWYSVNLFENDGYARLIRALRVRAEKIGVVLVKQNWLPNLTNPHFAQPRPVLTKKSQVKEKTESQEPNRKLQPRDIGTMIGIGVTIIASLIMMLGILPQVFTPTVSITLTPLFTTTLTSTLTTTSTPKVSKSTAIPSVTFTPTEINTLTSTPQPTVYVQTLNRTSGNSPLTVNFRIANIPVECTEQQCDVLWEVYTYIPNPVYSSGWVKIEARKNFTFTFLNAIFIRGTKISMNDYVVKTTIRFTTNRIILHESAENISVQ